MSSQPPAPLPWTSQQPMQEPRTVYYKKETNRAGVRQTAAVDLAPPMAVTQMIVPIDTPPKYDAATMLEARKPGSDGVPPLFRLEAEKDLVARENAERMKRTPKPKADELMSFPPLAPTSLSPFVARALAPYQAVIEPNYVCYGRLLFEDKNSERYGWTMGPLQPFTDLATFLGNTSNLAYNVCSFPGLRYDCSAGLCLPGDPVPYLLYPPGFSVSGILGSAGVNVALWAVIP